MPISDRNAKDPATRPAAPAGLHWGDADIPQPEGRTSSSGSGEREVKGLFGVGAPPPPVGASLAGAPGGDPLASLFGADTIVKAPGIQDAPSEAELGRWRATMQSSLFEERVIDPPPAASLPAPPVSEEPPAPAPLPAARLAPPPAPPAAPAPPRSVPRESPPLELATEEEPPMPVRAELRHEPAPVLAPVPAPAKGRSSKNTGKRRKAAAEAAAEREPAPAKRRRFERGPSKGMLAALGILALSTITALVIVLRPASDPVADAARMVPAPAPAAAPPAAPVAAPVAPAAQAAPATPSAAPASAKSEPASAKSEPAKSEAAKSEPAKSEPAKSEPPPTAKAAGAPVATPAAEEGDEEGAPEGLLRASRQALSADNPQLAESLAREGLAKAPQDHHAMELLVLALMDQDRGQEALPWARKMVQKRSRRVPYRLLLGDLLLMVGDQAGARAEWEKALTLAPTDKSIKRRLGL